MTDTTMPTEQPTRWSSLLPNISTGLVFGLSEVILGVSIASLIFSGSLADYLPRGIALVLVTSAVSMFITTLFSSFKGALSGIQEDPAVLVAVTISSLVAGLGAGGDVIPTVIAIILTTTLLAGGFMLVIGHFGWGGLMRYIPYPVIGGFMAGMGWLLVQGAFEVSAEQELGLESLPQLLQAEQIILWLPAVVFGLVLFFGVRQFRHYLVMPGIVFGGFVLFYGLLAITGTSVQTATSQGLLLGDMGSSAAWNPLPLQDLKDANWGAILGEAGNIGAIIMLSTVALLLNISALELEVKTDLDLNRELRVAGTANVVSALSGGMIGFHDLSYTSLVYRMGGRGRLMGLIIGGMCVATLVLGTSLLAYIPKPLLGGLLLFLGLNFLDEWVVEGYRKLARVEYAVVLLILLIIAATNFLIGVGVGLIVMIIIFVVNYSRINIFHHILSGSETASRVERNAHHQRELVKLGGHIYVLELEGFIFFGTANTILDQIRKRLDDPLQKPLLYLILDFRRVTGLDSSAMFSLIKVRHLADARDFRLVLTHVTEHMQTELERSGLPPDERVLYQRDLDYGLEWCEEQMLDLSQITKSFMPINLQVQLGELGFPLEYTDRLKTYLEKLTLSPSDYLIQQGETRYDLYFIEIGQVSVFLELDNGEQVRIQTPSMGTVVGELSFYLDVPRSASVIADYNTVAYRLTREKLDEMKASDPELAIAFNEMMVRVIAERLVANNRELMALHR